MYQKYLTKLGELIIFEPCTCILFIFQRLRSSVKVKVKYHGHIYLKKKVVMRAFMFNTHTQTLSPLLS